MGVEAANPGSKDYTMGGFVYNGVRKEHATLGYPHRIRAADKHIVREGRERRPDHFAIEELGTFTEKRIGNFSLGSRSKITR